MSVLLSSHSIHGLHIKLLCTRICYPLLPDDDLVILLYSEHHQYILRGVPPPVNFLYSEAAVSGHTHALTTG